MRLLLMPNVGMKNLRGDSNFNVYADMARTFVEVSDGKVWNTLVLPEDSNLIEAGLIQRVTPETTLAASDVVLVDDRGMHVLTRASNIPKTSIEIEPGRTNFTRQDKAVDPGLIQKYDRTDGTHFVDAVITSRKRIPVNLVSLHDDRRTKDAGRCPTYLIDPDVEFWPYRPEQEALTAMAYALSTPIFLTEDERKLATTLCKKWLSAALVDEVMQRALVMPLALPWHLMDEVIREVEAERRGPSTYATDTNTPLVGEYEERKFTLFFGARFSPYKRVPKVAEAFDYVFAAGHDVRVVMTTPTDETPTDRFFDRVRYPYVELHCRVGRNEYLRKAARAQAFVVMSSAEALPVGFVEQMYVGPVGILPDKMWVRQALPEWYPYIARDKEQFVSWLNVLRKRWETTGTPWAEGEHEKLRAWLRETYSARNSYERLFRRIESDRNSRAEMAPAMSLVLDVLKATTETEVSLRTLLKRMQALSIHGFKADQARSHRRRLFPSDYEVYRVALASGWDDAFDGPEVTLCRG